MHITVHPIQHTRGAAVARVFLFSDACHTIQCTLFWCIFVAPVHEMPLFQVPALDLDKGRGGAVRKTIIVHPNRPSYDPWLLPEGPVMEVAAHGRSICPGPHSNLLHCRIHPNTICSEVAVPAAVPVSTSGAFNEDLCYCFTCAVTIHIDPDPFAAVPHRC